MNRLVRFSKGYFLLTIALFVIEVLIAKFLNDRIVRPYIGDVLVVILMYCFVRSFLDTPVLPSAIGVLLFACLIELLQYVNIVERLGLQNSSLARTVLGTSAEWTDIFAYLCGFVLLLFGENMIPKNKSKQRG